MACSPDAGRRGLMYRLNRIPIRSIRSTHVQLSPRRAETAGMALFQFARPFGWKTTTASETTAVFRKLPHCQQKDRGTPCDTTRPPAPGVQWASGFIPTAHAQWAPVGIKCPEASRPQHRMVVTGRPGSVVLITHERIINTNSRCCKGIRGNFFVGPPACDCFHRRTAVEWAAWSTLVELSRPCEAASIPRRDPWRGRRA